MGHGKRLMGRVSMALFAAATAQCAPGSYSCDTQQTQVCFEFDGARATVNAEQICQGYGGVYRQQSCDNFGPFLGGCRDGDGSIFWFRDGYEDAVMGITIHGPGDVDQYCSRLGYAFVTVR